MRPLPLLLILSATMFFIAGCTTASLKELRRTEPAGSAFQKALSKLYLEYAESEAAQYDWMRSQYFAEKGLAAAYGRDVPPEELEDWDLQPETEVEIAAARDKLLAAFAAGMTSTQPQQAAKAQYYFDCWVEQSHEAWQPADVESCRQGFHGEMAQLASSIPETQSLLTPLTGSSAAPPIMPSATAPIVPAPVIAGALTLPPPSASPAPAISYLVFFIQGTILLPDSARVLDTVIANLRQRRDYTVILNGHSDQGGSEQANLDLSQKRVDAVKARLVQGGIDATRIQTFAFGESDPRIVTEDGKAEPANRRVEIIINPEP